MSAEETVALARELRRQMLRDSVPPDIFVTGPDYAGSVGSRVLDIYGDGALEFLRSIDRATLAQGSVLIRDDAPNVTAYMGSLGIFKQERQTGMICAELAGVPRPPLPDSLRLSRVQVGDISDPRPSHHGCLCRRDRGGGWSAARFDAASGAPDGGPAGAVVRCR